MSVGRVLDISIRLDPEDSDLKDQLMFIWIHNEMALLEGGGSRRQHLAEGSGPLGTHP